MVFGNQCNEGDQEYNNPSNSGTDKGCCIGCLSQTNSQFASASVEQNSANVNVCGSDSGGYEVDSGGTNVSINDEEIWVNGKKVEPEGDTED